MSWALFNGKAGKVFIFITAVLDIVAMGIVIPVLPKLIEVLSRSSAQAGVMLGVFVALWGLMQFVSSPILGALSDQFGRRPVILLSTAGLAAAYGIMALAPDLWWLALGRLIAGSTSASFTTVYAYMADVTPAQCRAKAFGFIGAAFSAGVVAGPLLGGVLGEVSLRLPFWSACVLSSVAFMYGALILPESLPPDRRTPFTWKRANAIGAMGWLAARRILLRLALINFLLYAALYVMPTVLVLYANYRYGWGLWEAGALFALMGVLDMFVQTVLVGPVTRRLGERKAVMAGLYAGAFGMLCMGLAPHGWLFALAMAPTALRTLAIPSLQSLMTQQVSALEQGQLQGANMSLISIAGIVSPLFFGAVYSVSIGGERGEGDFAGVAFLLAALVLGVAILVLHTKPATHLSRPVGDGASPLERREPYDVRD